MRKALRQPGWGGQGFENTWSVVEQKAVMNEGSLDWFESAFYSLRGRSGRYGILS